MFMRYILSSLILSNCLWTLQTQTTNEFFYFSKCRTNKNKKKRFFMDMLFGRRFHSIDIFPELCSPAGKKPSSSCYVSVGYSFWDRMAGIFFFSASDVHYTYLQPYTANRI